MHGKELGENDMKNICMLATGGTIACRKGADGMRPGIAGQALAAHLPAMHEAAFDAVELFALDSSNLAPHHWKEMARAVAARREAYDGFIVTHGTDTMAYTAAALSIMLAHIDVPVVLTGSQLSVEEAGSDAQQNLQIAAHAAVSGRAGVFVAFGGQLIEGARARKLCTEQLAAFASIGAPAAALFHGGRLHWQKEWAAPKEPFHLRDALDTRVAVLKLVPGASAELLRALVNTGYRAVILEGFGAGGVPTDAAEESFIAALDYARSQGIAVIATTQCVYDGVHLSRYENGVLALRHGAVSGGAHTTEYLYAWAMAELGEQGCVRLSGTSEIA